jgi:hypothetical protein
VCCPENCCPQGQECCGPQGECPQGTVCGTEDDAGCCVPEQAVAQAERTGRAQPRGAAGAAGLPAGRPR